MGFPRQEYWSGLLFPSPILYMDANKQWLLPLLTRFIYTEYLLLGPLTH